MTDFMQPYSLFASLLNDTVLDAVNENALYFSIPYYAVEEEHIHEAYDKFLEQYPNMSLTWDSANGYWDFELKESKGSLIYKKSCILEELNILLKEQQSLLNKIQILQADLAALKAIEEADDLLHRLS